VKEFGETLSKVAMDSMKVSKAPTDASPCRSRNSPKADNRPTTLCATTGLMQRSDSFLERPIHNSRDVLARTCWRGNAIFFSLAERGIRKRRRLRPTQIEF